jgi:hypothetical protein
VYAHATQQTVQTPMSQLVPASRRQCCSTQNLDPQSLPTTSGQAPSTGFGSHCTTATGISHVDSLVLYRNNH